MSDNLIDILKKSTQKPRRKQRNIYVLQEVDNAAIGLRKKLLAERKDVPLRQIYTAIVEDYFQNKMGVEKEISPRRQQNPPAGIDLSGLPKEFSRLEVERLYNVNGRYTSKEYKSMINRLARLEKSGKIVKLPSGNYKKTDRF